MEGGSGSNFATLFTQILETSETDEKVQKLVQLAELGAPQLKRALKNATMETHGFVKPGNLNFLFSSQN